MNDYICTFKAKNTIIHIALDSADSSCGRDKNYAKNERRL